jgi:hypothetical protein
MHRRDQHLRSGTLQSGQHIQKVGVGRVETQPKAASLRAVRLATQAVEPFARGQSLLARWTFQIITGETARNCASTARVAGSEVCKVGPMCTATTCVPGGREPSAQLGATQASCRPAATHRQVGGEATR